MPSSMTRARAAALSRRAALLAAAASTLAPCVARAATTEPEGFIADLGQRALAILRNSGSQPSRDQIAALLDEAVDLPLLARLVLGRHWRAATEEQRASYVALFRAYALQGLTTALSVYSGQERLVITGSRPLDDGDRLVASEFVIDPARPANRIDWRVRAQGSELVVVDVVAEGVSLLVTNRSEVDSIVARSGIDGLLREMRSWTEEGGGA